MRLYTIANALILSLGAVSVVARCLPEGRSEANIRIAGGHDFSNPLKKLEAADAKVDTAVSKVTTLPATTSKYFRRFDAVCIPLTTLTFLFPSSLWS